MILGPYLIKSLLYILTFHPIVHVVWFHIKNWDYNWQRDSSISCKQKIKIKLFMYLYTMCVCIHISVYVFILSYSMAYHTMLVLVTFLRTNSRCIIIDFGPLCPPPLTSASQTLKWIKMSCTSGVNSVNVKFVDTCNGGTEGGLERWLIIFLGDI